MNKHAKRTPIIERQAGIDVGRRGPVDLYDRVNLIPWDKLTSFFHRSLAVKEW